MRDYRKLNVWLKAHKLTLVVYALTKKFPKEEMYGLTGQLRRAASSIPTNIAEGCGRTSDAELNRFLDIAAGSASEVEYLLLLVRDLGFIEDAECEVHTQSVAEIKKMLRSLSTKLKANF